MQLVNFHIDSGFTSLIFQGRHFDLHNNFEFQQLSIDEMQKTAEIIFTKGIGEWVPETDPDRLILCFRNVREFSQKDHAFDYPAQHLKADASTIDMIGFSYEGDRSWMGLQAIIPEATCPRCFSFL